MKNIFIFLSLILFLGGCLGIEPRNEYQLEQNLYKVKIEEVDYFRVDYGLKFNYFDNLIGILNENLDISLLEENDSCFYEYEKSTGIFKFFIKQDDFNDVLAQENNYITFNSSNFYTKSLSVPELLNMQSPLILLEKLSNDSAAGIYLKIPNYDSDERGKVVIKRNVVSLDGDSYVSKVMENRYYFDSKGEIKLQDPIFSLSYEEFNLNYSKAAELYIEYKDSEKLIIFNYGIIEDDLYNSIQSSINYPREVELNINKNNYLNTSFYKKNYFGLLEELKNEKLHYYITDYKKDYFLSTNNSKEFEMPVLDSSKILIQTLTEKYDDSIFTLDTNKHKFLYSILNEKSNFIEIPKSLNEYNLNKVPLSFDKKFSEGNTYLDLKELDLNDIRFNFLVSQSQGNDYFYYTYFSRAEGSMVVIPNDLLAKVELGNKVYICIKKDSSLTIKYIDL